MGLGLFENFQYPLPLHSKFFDFLEIILRFTTKFQKLVTVIFARFGTIEKINHFSNAICVIFFFIISRNFCLNNSQYLFGNFFHFLASTEQQKHE